MFNFLFPHKQVIEYLACKLNTTMTRIDTHLHVYQNDKIAAMYFMVLKTLVKEVLHPLKVFENSFLYRFECWRENLYSQHLQQKYTYGKQHLDAKEKEENFRDEKSLLTLRNVSTDDSDFKIPSKNFDRKLTDLKLQTGSECKLWKINSPEFPIECCGKKDRQYILGDICNEEKSEKEQEENVTRNPYRSYRKSRPENVSFSKNNNREIVKHNECRDEMKEIPTNLAPNQKKSSPLAKEDRSKDCQNFYHDNQKTELSYGRKVSIRCYREFSPRVSATERNKMKCTSYSNTKTLVNKFSEEAIKPYSTKNHAKTNFSVNETSSIHKPNSSTKNIRILKRTDKNIDLQQVIPKTLHKNNASSETPKRQPTNGFKKMDEISKNVYAQTPSRIPVKIMQYGPPAPFSQPLVPSIRKGTRKTEPNGIKFCRGNAGENIK